MVLIALAVCLGTEEFRIEGPPFLPLGETASYRVSVVPEGTEVEWKIADAPGGWFADIVTCPRFDANRRTVRGARSLRVTSVGKRSGDVRIEATLRRRSRKIASAVAWVRLGEVLRVRAWCRVVEHGKGGTRRPELFLEEDRRKSLERDVNLLLRPCGVAVTLERGRTVAGKEKWFDKKHRFHPVVKKHGTKARSAVFRELVRHNHPGGLNIYLLRDCHWTERRSRFRGVVWEHPLQGVGMKAGDIVIDDSAGAVTLAHELGHAFGLADLERANETDRLMYSVWTKRTGRSFIRQEMLDARRSARLHLRRGCAVRR